MGTDKVRYTDVASAVDAGRSSWDMARRGAERLQVGLVRFGVVLSRTEGEFRQDTMATLASEFDVGARPSEASKLATIGSFYVVQGGVSPQEIGAAMPTVSGWRRLYDAYAYFGPKGAKKRSVDPLSPREIVERVRDGWQKEQKERESDPAAAALRAAVTAYLNAGGDADELRAYVEGVTPKGE